MAATTERAILAGGCFWGMQRLVRRLPGVVSTRVGYSRGDVKNATYHNHGTHAEALSDSRASLTLSAARSCRNASAVSTGSATNLLPNFARAAPSAAAHPSPEELLGVSGSW